MMNSEKYVYAEQCICNWNSEISMQKYHSFITLFARSTIYLVPLFVLLEVGPFLGRGGAETKLQHGGFR